MNRYEKWVVNMYGEGVVRKFVSLLYHVKRIRLLWH
jgi:hypothetical protein